MSKDIKPQVVTPDTQKGRTVSQPAPSRGNSGNQSSGNSGSGSNNNSGSKK
jgi:hypothetical protein